MPPKRSGKKGQTAKNPGASSGKAAAGGSAAPHVSSSRSEAREEEKVAPLSKADSAAKQLGQEVGTKRAEPEPTTGDLEATLQRRQKLAEELQAVEKQVSGRKAAREVKCL